MTHSPGPMKGIAYMIATVFLLSISDAAAKWLAPHYPAIQIVCVRALLGVGPALCLLLWGEGRRGLATAHLVWHASRSLLMLGSWLLFILALRSISLATAYTLVFGAPLFMTLFCRVFLGEHVTWPRWVAVGGGFLGVLLVLSPASMGVNTAAFSALLAALVWAVTSLIARRLSQQEPSSRILFYYMAMSVLATVPFAALTWTPIAVAHLPVFLLTGLVGVVAHWLLAQAFRYGEVSVIAPFEYTGLVWALVFGYWLWGDVPTAGVLSGGGLIIASGLYMIRAERGRRQSEGPEAASESAPTPASSSASGASIGAAGRDEKKLASRWAEGERGELIILLEDEWHLVWGDVCGMVWGRRNTAIAVPMTNERERQTDYGAINLLTKTVHLQERPVGDGANTVAYLQWCQALYPDKKLLLLWDGASYHRGQEMQTFLAQANAGLAEADWKITCVPFAPNAPEQNPLEDFWLKGKTYLRKHFAVNKTFAAVKTCFSTFLQALRFESVKYRWYWPDPQLI